MRIGLKSSLVILATLGAGAGLLGRLFLIHPELFFPVCAALVTIVPFLAAIGTILWLGRKHNIRRLWIWALLLLLIPPIGILGIFLLQSIGGTQGLGVLSNKRILSVSLPETVDEPWTWRELETRVNSGNLSSEEIDTALKLLTAHLKTKQTAGPLSSQKDFLFAVGAKKNKLHFAMLFMATQPQNSSLQTR